MEGINVPEAPVTKEMVMEAARKLLSKGVNNPDALDLDDPEVSEANSLFDKWRQAAENKARGDSKAERRAELEFTTFWVDAGFTDPVYLDDVLEWLDQDLHNAEESPELTELIPEIQAQIDRIQKIVGEE